jgi:hypothetical protein
MSETVTGILELLFKSKFIVAKLFGFIFTISGMGVLIFMILAGAALSDFNKMNKWVTIK